MCNAEENELLARTGPDTPMGDLMRQYWIPALMSSELPAPNDLPLRARTVALHCSLDVTRPRGYGACITTGSSA